MSKFYVGIYFLSSLACAAALQPVQGALTHGSPLLIDAVNIPGKFRADTSEKDGKMVHLHKSAECVLRLNFPRRYPAMGRAVLSDAEIDDDCMQSVKKSIGVVQQKIARLAILDRYAHQEEQPSVRLDSEDVPLLDSEDDQDDSEDNIQQGFLLHTWLYHPWR